MRPDCIRLLVADDLRLGRPVRTFLPLTDPTRDRVIDSTSLAWQQIQTLAVDREVDAVILNGDTLPIDDFTAEAEHMLRDGLSLLIDAEIRVILHPGHDEGRIFWREWLAEDAVLRNGVSLLSGTIPMPISLRSDGESDGDDEFYCRIVSIQDHILPEGSHFGADHSPFTLGINSRSAMTNSLPPGIDLRITGASAQWQQPHSDALHECRCSIPQALSHEEAGLQTESGCLLMEIHREGGVRVERTPTASVRFVECDLDLSACSDWDDAALALQNQIEAISRGELERVRLITWTLCSTDSMSLQLLEGSGVDSLMSAWGQSFPLEDDLQVVHGFRQSVHHPRHWIHSQTSDARKELAEVLFQQELTGENNRLEQLRTEWSSDEHSFLLWSRLNPHLRRDQISRHAEALMSRWLKTSDPENLPYETHIS